MAQTGQAAKLIKKNADAKPKVSTKKLVTDLAVNAAMFTPPGRLLKAAAIAGKLVKAKKAADVVEKTVAATRLERRARGGSATASRMQKASKSTDASRREATRRAENAAKEARVESAEIPRPTRIVKPEPRKPQPAAETFRVAQRNIRRNVAGVDKPKAKIPTSEATAIAKETGRRPIAPRPREIPKGSETKLTPREILYEKLGKKAPVKVIKKKPMSEAEIATIRKSKVESERIKRSEVPARPKGEKLKDKNFQLPKHKVKVTISKKETAAKPVLKVTRPARGNKIKVEDISRGRPTGWKDWPESKQQRWLEKRDRQSRNAAASANPNRYSKAKQEVGNRIATERNLEIGLVDVKKTMQGNKVKFAKKNAAKVETTLAKAKQAKQGRSLQNTFNKPIFKRNAKTGKLTVKQPIKPNKEQK